MNGLEGWINVNEGKRLTGYTRAHIRWLARTGKVTAVRASRDWLLRRDELLAYRERMQRLGAKKHDPWRRELAENGRGRTR